ncbi:BBA14 family lipoprotein [Borrelia sp. RT1S]|uniref:BBA14 family lipoprotein n=1 Tax=Borrelia sp. RT1S TaxID=2898580 RepID=UPI001E628390|nr:BBA14 family lipoprotein [Borrelia sp. RT1S]UGQ17907.1 BBA14 family lipoprotein [Borrelia sp. RT1S]
MSLLFNAKARILLLLLILLTACTTIASIPLEPEAPEEQSLDSLTKYESQLLEYVIYLQVFLVNTQKTVKDKDYPKFTFFDTNKLESWQTINALKSNITLMKQYIALTKPIAEGVYKKYSKRLSKS